MIRFEIPSRRLLVMPWASTLSLLVAGAFSPVSWGQTPADLPGRGVARTSLIDGDVSVRRGDTNEWVAAAVNGPLVVGDRVLSGVGSRAELQFDWASFLRLASNTEVRLAELERERYQVQLARGLATFALVRDSAAEIDINTPSVSVRPLRRGLYRISVEETADGTVTEIAVRSGEVEIYSPRGSQRLRAGRTLQVRGPVADPEFRAVSDLGNDDWDRWNQGRDREILRSSAYNYVSRDVFGAEVLDRYGDWIFVPTYGHVWSPRVAGGWAPYRHGRWSWVDYYGWTWISHDPWGWAPYHYGRWFWHSNRWCWWSGGPGVRTFWRPALVAWVGWGGVSVGVGIGGPGWGRVGWVPLAPYEPFRPWYGPGWYGGRNRVTNTTIINNVNVTNIYRNARTRDGITVVDGRRFGRGTVEALPPEGLERADLAQGPIPVPPTDRATRVTDQEARAIGSAGQDRFFSRRSPANVERIPFDEQRQAMENLARTAPVANTPGSIATGERAERSGPVEGRGNPTAFREGLDRADRRGEVSGRRMSDGDGGYRRIGEPGEGWRRVGEVAAPRPSDVPATGLAERSRRGEEAWRRFDGSLADQRSDRSGGVTGRERRDAADTIPSGDLRPDGGSRERSTGERGAWERFERRGSVGGGEPVGGRRESISPDGWYRGTERESGSRRSGSVRSSSDSGFADPGPGYDSIIEPRTERGGGSVSPRERIYQRESSPGGRDRYPDYSAPSSGRSRGDGGYPTPSYEPRRGGYEGVSGGGRRAGGDGGSYGSPGMTRGSGAEGGSSGRGNGVREGGGGGRRGGQ